MAQKITKKTTDLTIDSVLKAIQIEEHAPFELGKFYKITNGDCVGAYEINEEIAYQYTINELGNYFEHIATIEDIEDLENKALILKETFEQLKIMSESAEDEISYEALINETIAFLIQDEVYQGDEIELRFICDNIDITMIEKCFCCGKVLFPDDECYSDELNDDNTLCEHCSIFNDETNNYQKSVRQDVLEKITGYKFSPHIGNIGSTIEEFNHWLNRYKLAFGHSEESSKQNFIDFINGSTEYNICDCCGLIEKSTDLNWDDEDLFDEDYQNFRFLKASNIGFDAVCDDCLNKVQTISRPPLEDVALRIKENKMMHKVWCTVLLENVNFEERGIPKITVVGEICYMDFDKKTYKLKEFGEHEFKDEDFFDILNSAYIDEYVEFIAANHTDVSDKVDEWSYPNHEGFPDIDMAFEEFGFKDEFIEHLKAIHLPYGRFLTPKFKIGDTFNFPFDYGKKIVRIDKSFTEEDEIVYWSDEYDYIAESELEKQKASINEEVDDELDEILIVKNDILHNIFCIDSDNDIVVPTFNELESADKYQPNWQLTEEYRDYSLGSIIQIVNELTENFFSTLEVLNTHKEKIRKSKKYSVREQVEFGVPVEVVNALQELYEQEDEITDPERKVMWLQANFSNEDVCSIEIVLDSHIDFEKLEMYFKNTVDDIYNEEIDMLIEAIKQAKEDDFTTLYVYDC